MATVPAKHHQPLHNFTLPFLKWGQRTQLPNHHRRRSPLANSDLNNRTKPRRRRIQLTEREILEENRSVLPAEGNSNSNGSGKLIDVDVVPATNGDGDAKPWNLRPRRFVIDTVDGNGNGAVRGSPEQNQEETEMKKKKRGLWISLSKDEIEEDIFAFTGSKPSRRPKKRNKIEQKHLDNVFPGLYLVGISADSYRV